MRPPIASSAAVAAAIALLSAAPIWTALAAPAVGSDISWPQCGDAPPRSAFGIVGVNGGVVFTSNPCLAEQIAWAGVDRLQLYANTGNAGPDVSSRWPTGQSSPRPCLDSAPDTAACAYDHGWNAAADSYRDALAAFRKLGATRSPASVPWWLDVEVTNSWRTDTALNIADLSGALAFLTGVGVPVVGFYSTAYQWATITGGTRVFRAHPSWVAGAKDAAAASAACRGDGFTGGPVDLVQFVSGGLDLDVLCRPVLPPAAKPRPSARPRPVVRTVRVTPPIPAARRLSTVPLAARSLSTLAAPAVSVPAPSSVASDVRAVPSPSAAAGEKSVPPRVRPTPDAGVPSSRRQPSALEGPLVTSSARSTDAPAALLALLPVLVGALGLVVMIRRPRDD